MSVIVAKPSPGQAEVKPKPAPTLNQVNSQPFVEVTEQPKSHGLRFRYECEGRCAGSIPGESSTESHRTYPTITIHNYNGPSAVVVVSLVTKDNPPKPHPHRLVGRDCKDGVCTMKLSGTYTASFPNIGIQCVKKGAAKDSLQKRKDLRVDPFCTGFGHMENQGDIDMSIVKLCWQVFLPDSHGKFTRALRPVTSEFIYDKKTASDLTICRLSKNSGSVRGGDEVFLLCEKVHKDDIEVQVIEEKGEVQTWAAKCEFGPADVHKQHAIVLKMPAYHDLMIEKAVEVKIQLYRPSDKTTSEPKTFMYIPEDPDPDAIESKKKRKKVNALSSFMTDTVPNGLDAQLIPATVEPVDVKQRIIKKVARNKDRSASTSKTSMSASQSDITEASVADVQSEEEVATTPNPMPEGVAAVYADLLGSSFAQGGNILIPNTNIALPISGVNIGGDTGIAESDMYQLLTDNQAFLFDQSSGRYILFQPSTNANTLFTNWEQAMPSANQNS